MYMNLIGKPTDADLDKFPLVLLTGPYEWDPSVLDYTHPATADSPFWTPSPSQHDEHDPRNDEFAHFKRRVHHFLTHPPGRSTISHNKHAINTQPIDFEKLRPYFGLVNKHTIEKTFNKTTQWPVLHYVSYEEAFHPDSQLSTSLGDLKRLPLIPSSHIPLPLTLVSPWHRILLVREL